MAYCDLLYRPGNIIGYTGDVDNDPTVYFCTPSTEDDGSVRTTQVGDNMQILFLHGHITQNHPKQKNIGREKAFESWSYSIMNVGPEYEATGSIEEGKKVLQEVYHQSEVAPNNRRYWATPDGFSDFHISRNEFNPVDSTTDAAIVTKLSKAIGRFPLVKTMYGAIPDDEIKRLN